jgi:hypothetical protein
MTMAKPSKICSAGSSKPPMVTKSSTPMPMLNATAAPAPSQILPKWRWFPVFAR